MRFLERNATRLAWLFSIIGTLGSLYFSEIANYAPCSLCWYQRIAMYPLVIILGIGSYKNDKKAAYYSLPLAVIGLLVAIYQNLEYFHIVPESTTSCRFGVSCTVHYINWFGFVSIPLLSLVGFLILVGLLWLANRPAQAKPTL